MKKKSKAFTLIEVLVVLVIISIVTMIAMLTFGDFGKARKIKTVAERLTTVLPLAQQEAMLQPTVLGLQIFHHGYQFAKYKINTKTQQGTWQPLTHDKIFGLTNISSDIYLRAITKKKTILIRSDKIKLLFMPDGTTSAFNIYIGFVNELPKYKINVNTEGVVKLIEITHAS